LATAAAFQPPSGTPTDGQKLLIQIKDDGSPRLLTWSTTGYDQESIALPTTTEASTTLTVGFLYVTANSLNRWQLVASTQGTRGPTGATGSTGPTGPTGPTGRLPAVTSNSSSATPTPNVDTTDIFELTNQGANMSFQTPAGTPSNGQRLDIFIRSNAAASGWTIAWTTGYTGSQFTSTSIIQNPLALPGTQVTGRTALISFRYTTAGSVNKWMLISNVGYLQ
jgi:hypothetical protein